MAVIDSPLAHPSSKIRRLEVIVRKPLVRIALLLGLALAPSIGFPWGREGHEIIVILAQHYMRPETTARVRDLLGSGSLEEASFWLTSIDTTILRPGGLGSTSHPQNPECAWFGSVGLRRC